MARASWPEAGDRNNLDDGPAKRVVGAVERLGTSDAGRRRRAEALPGHGNAVAGRIDACELLDTTAPSGQRADGGAAGEFRISLERVAPFAGVALDAQCGTGTVGRVRVARSHRTRCYVSRRDTAVRAQACRHVVQKNKRLRARVRFDLDRLHLGLQAREPQNAERENDDRDEGFEQAHAALAIQIQFGKRPDIHVHAPLVTTGSPLKLTCTQRFVAVCVAETENLGCVVPATRPELRYVTTPGLLMEILLVAACVSIFDPPTATAQPAAHVPAGESVTSVFCLMDSLRARNSEVNRSIAAICTR